MVRCALREQKGWHRYAGENRQLCLKAEGIQKSLKEQMALSWVLKKSVPHKEEAGEEENLQRENKACTRQGSERCPFWELGTVFVAGARDLCVEVVLFSPGRLNMSQR